MMRIAPPSRGLVASLALASLMLFPAVSRATTAIPVPEPESWALVAVAVVAVVVVRVRNKRK